MLFCVGVFSHVYLGHSYNCVVSFFSFLVMLFDYKYEANLIKTIICGEFDVERGRFSLREEGIARKESQRESIYRQTMT